MEEAVFPAELGLRLHHLGVAATSLDEGTALYRALGYRAVSPVVEDPHQGVRVQFWQLGTEVLVEVVAPGGPGSPVDGFLGKTGGGVYHLCYECADLERTLDWIRSHQGLTVRPPLPAAALEGRRVAFVYWHRALVEFLER